MHVSILDFQLIFSMSDIVCERIGGVMISAFILSAVDRGSETPLV